MTMFLLGCLFMLIILALQFFGYILGWVVCSKDVENRLKGKWPVDDYWRKRGMKDVAP